MILVHTLGSLAASGNFVPFPLLIPRSKVSFLLARGTTWFSFSPLHPLLPSMLCFSLSLSHPLLFHSLPLPFPLPIRKLIHLCDVALWGGRATLTVE